ncbi:flagellar hook-length control protein FliK [Enterobacteriaceae bacterium 89]|nr:flagellar hook-length control protein FliK [Enterobacteriaceae bacterium 89]
MITLPKILVSDSDITSGIQTAKTGEATGGAEDFFALLSGAMAGKTAKGSKAALTLADLQDASKNLPQGASKTTLSQLLAQQDETDTQKVDLSSLSDAQAVFNALSPEAKSDVVKQLNKDLGKDDDKSTLKEDALAGINALLAMLPHAQTTSVASKSDAVAVSAGTDASAARSALTELATSAKEVVHQDKSAGKSFTLPQAAQGQQPVTGDALNQGSPLATAAAAKASDNSTLSAATSVPMAPVVSNATATVNTHPVVAVNSQLGTPEWQQNISQHITLFTRQGQQTAELKLHPENLGQVNITLKLDDNQAQISMVSAHSHVRAALEAAIPVLRTQLADNGIQLAQSNVSGESFAGQQQQSSFGQSSSQRSAEGQAFAADEDESLSVPATLQAQARGNGIVDTFA